MGPFYAQAGSFFTCPSWALGSAALQRQSGSWCSGITFALHAKGPGFKSQRVHFISFALQLKAMLGLSTCSAVNFRDSIVVSISACHADDPGSIPGRGKFIFCRAPVCQTGLGVNAAYSSHRKGLFRELNPGPLAP